MDAWWPQLLAWLSLPEVGLTSVFVIALVSATLLPMGSEPAVLIGLSHNEITGSQTCIGTSRI